MIVDTVVDVGRQRLGFADAADMSSRVLTMLDADDFDVCTIIYNKFQSAMTQIVTRQQLVPFCPPRDR